MAYEAALADYQRFEFDDGRWMRSVYRRGSGPAVIVMHEIPGLNPLVIRFADRVAAAGMTVFCPSLFGEPGRPASPAYVATSFVRACLRREFAVWASDRSSPIVDWLRALARRAHGECGGKGVGAVGMCFTGGFALAMTTDPAVTAPVVSQPTLPLTAGSRARAAAIGASPDEIACVRGRMNVEPDLSLLGLRFKSDRLVPDARFLRYRREFGDRFEAIELEDEDAARAPIPPHAVLTLHLKEDGPTKAAEQRVIRFLREGTGAA